MAKAQRNVTNPDDDTIERRPLFQQIADRIRDMILEGDYEPGERLQEKELSERFGVSRTPLREALKVLSSEGWVTHAPNRGATITHLSDQEIAETYPVMGALEGLAGELACQNATDAEINEIAKLHADMVDAHQARALADYYEINQRIHAAIFAAARNDLLVKTYAQLTGRARRARFRGTMSDARWAQAVREHELILVALQSRKAKALGEALRRHTDTKFETVREGLES